MKQNLPIPSNEQERLKALDSYKIMDTEPEERLDNLTQLAAQICEVPICLISLVDDERQWFKSKVGLGADQTPREISFCQYAIMDVGIFEVENAKEDSRFTDNVLVNDDPNIRFYAGQPLIDDNGFALGTLCVIDEKPKKLKDNQRLALQILAKEVISEIQARKQKEDLSAYMKFFEVSIDMFCIAGTDGYFKAVNPAFERVLGWTEKELFAKPFLDFIHPDDIAATNKEVEKLSTGAITIGFENRYKTKSGEWVWMHWTAHPDPSTGELYAVAHDISELKKAMSTIERMQKENEAELCAIDQAVIRMELSPEGKILNVNKNFSDIVGYDSSLIGQDHSTLLFNEDKESEGYSKFWEELRNNNAQQKEFRRKSKSGDAIWIKGSYIPVTNEDKEVTKIIKLAYDITKEQQLLEALSYLNNFQKGILNGSKHLIISTDVTGTIVSFNQGAEELLGYTAEEMVNKASPAQFHDLNEVVEKAQALSEEFGVDIQPGFEAFVYKAREQKTADENEWTYIRKDGKRIPVILSVTALWNDSGEVTGYLGIAYDYTEKQAFIEEIQYKNKELDQFAYIVTHDLKAPLRAISTLSDFIEEDLEGKLEDDVLKNFEMLRSRVTRMEGLINGILEYSRIGRVTVKMESFSCDEALKDVMSGLQMKPNFSLEIDANLPRIDYNRVQFEQVMQNLISNGFKYHDKDEGTVKVMCKDLGDFHEFSIEDDGPGIEEKYHDRIFTIFQTLQSRDEIESTGVGLSIVKKIVEEYGGTMRLDSALGEGSKFIFTVPKST